MSPLAVPNTPSPWPPRPVSQCTATQPPSMCLGDTGQLGKALQLKMPKTNGETNTQRETFQAPSVASFYIWRQRQTLTALGPTKRIAACALTGAVRHKALPPKRCRAVLIDPPSTCSHGAHQLKGRTVLDRFRALNSLLLIKIHSNELIVLKR